MQGSAKNWNVRRHGPMSYTTYNENMQWNQNFRRPGLPRGSIHNSDYQYWCETCDKGFMTAHFLENHKTQHQKCSIDGCQFVAHPKIITKHIQMQHSTGIFKRIAKLNNPEDIEKWREERKRKYPTIENIKKKEAATREKIKRGEKMGIEYGRSKKFVKTEFRHETNQRPSQRGRTKHPHDKYIKNVTNSRKRIATDITKKLEFPKKICKVAPPIEESRTLKPFAGIQLLQFNDDLDEETESETQFSVPIEDEDIHIASDKVQKETSVSEPIVCSALTSLMCCYESSDEDDVETNTQCKEIKKSHNENKIEYKIENKGKNNNKTNYQVNQTKMSEQTNCTENISDKINVELQNTKGIVSNCKGDSDDESGPEEVKISKEVTSLPVDDIKIPKIKPKKELYTKTVQRPSPNKYEFRKRNKLPSTLLEKLLHREIQHERNVILQCVRYVVKNKYFENR